MEHPTVSYDEPPSEFDAQTEMTLVFHSSTNPFGEDYDEEELVFDGLISPDALAQRHRRQVECQASHRLAQQISEVRQQAASDRSPQSDTSMSVRDAMTVPPPQPESPATESNDDEERSRILCLDDHVTQRQVDGRRNPSPPTNTAAPDDNPLNANKAATEDSARSYRHLFSQLRLRRG